jgi:4a-hydroxytetrahydrobiopterin dehydratase
MAAMSTETLSAREVAEAGLTGWLHVPGALVTRVRTGDFATGLRLVDAVGAAAEEMNHHPDLTIRYAEVDVRLSSHDVGGVTERDVRLARRVGELAGELGAHPSCAELSVLELALDTPASSAVMPFWEAVLRARRTSPDDLTDPSGSLPPVWFQESGDEEPRQRWHLDLWVDPARVDDLVRAAEEAGGRLVSDAHAPSFWVLADPEGNQVCLCTQQER